MARRKKDENVVEDGQVPAPEVVAADDDGLVRELAVENQVAVQEHAEENQEEIASGDVDDKSVEEVEAFNFGARVRGEPEEQVQAPDDPEHGTGTAASPADVEDILPSEGDYAGVRDPNFQFQEAGKVRLIDGDAVPIEEAVDSAESSE